MAERTGGDYSAAEQFNDIVEGTRRPEGLRGFAETVKQTRYSRIHLQAFNKARVEGNNRVAELIVDSKIVDDAEEDIDANKIGITNFIKWYLPEEIPNLIPKESEDPSRL